MMQGFRDFILKGNAIDLAVGVIIGAAFGKVVDGFMKSIVEPIIKLLLGTSDPAKGFEQIALGPFPLGILIAAIVNLILVGAVLYFVIVQPMNRLNKPAPAAPAGPPEDVKLLGEIRDLLARK